MIYYSTPYRSDKNIGKYYNDFMSLIPNDDDWVCFTDADTMFLTPFFGQLIEESTSQKKYDVLTCFTNRIGNPKQNVELLDFSIKNDDIQHHRAVAEMVQQKYGSKIEDFDSWKSHAYGKANMSGMLILRKKKVWNDCKFIDGNLGVDNAFHEETRKNGYKVGIIKGLYIYHWYRGGNSTKTEHLK